MEETINAKEIAAWQVSDAQVLRQYSAEDTVTIYGALSTYLTILAQQPEKDLETIARVTRLMIAIKPEAVEASQEIANRTSS